MKYITLILISFTLSSYTQDVDKYIKESMTSYKALLKRAYEKENYTKNDMIVTIILLEINHADNNMLLAQKNQLNNSSFTLIMSNFMVVYSFALDENLKLNEDETNLIKSFINRSGKFLSLNLNKITANPRFKKIYTMEYETLLKVAQKYDHKIEESKKLLDKFNKK